MSTLTIYNHPSQTITWQSADSDAIKQKLAENGVRFARWQTNHPLSEDPTQEQVLNAYQPEIDQLVAEAGYQSWDVVSIRANNPNKEAMRAKFLDEHTHGEDEVRFFVEGSGLFCLHLGDQIYQILCEKGDLLGVPAGAEHWFDMGSEPYFTAIRIFNNPEGWKAKFTGNPIANEYPTLA